MFGLGAQEVLIVLAIGVLLFGKKLPEVGRSLGKGLMEFQQALRGVESDVEATGTRPQPSAELPRPPQRVAATAVPRFEDHAGSTVETTAS